MARIGHKLNEDGGKNISQGGSSFSQLGDDGDIGMQGARKLESEQVIVVQMCHPHGFGAYGARGAPNTVFGPDRGAGKAYGLLLEAMRSSGKVGIARVVLRTKQALCCLRPMGDALALSTMNYADEIVPQKDLDLGKPPAPSPIISVEGSP